MSYDQVDNYGEVKLSKSNFSKTNANDWSESELNRVSGFFISEKKKGGLNGVRE